MTRSKLQTLRWRMLLAIFVATPVALYVVFCACMALGIAFSLLACQLSHPAGIALLGLALLAFWYFYALFHTLLTDRGTPRSAVALALGVIGLSDFLWHIVQRSIRIADYGFQTFAVAPVLFVGLVLSAVLFVRIVFAERLGLCGQKKKLSLSEPANGPENGACIE
jgi:hypothetical protein